MYQMSPLNRWCPALDNQSTRLPQIDTTWSWLYYRVLELGPHLLGGFRVRPSYLYYTVRLLLVSVLEKSEGRSQKGQ